MKIIELYVNQKLSICQISALLEKPQSTIRYHLKKANVLRNRSDAIRLAAQQGRLGLVNKGKKKYFTEEQKKKISQSKILYGDKNAKGVSIKPNGYVEFTRGVHKGRSVHCVIIEESIGRKLFANEVVHHIDGNKQNNSLENLQLMTRADHCSLHSKINNQSRKRNKYGKYQ